MKKSSMEELLEYVIVKSRRYNLALPTTLSLEWSLRAHRELRRAEQQRREPNVGFVRACNHFAAQLLDKSLEVTI